MRQSPFLPNRPLKVAVLGSSGAVGSELLKILEQRDFPISELVLLSSERSEGKKIIWKGEELVTKKTTKEEFQNLDLVLASAGGSISKNKFDSNSVDEALEKSRSQFANIIPVTNRAAKLGDIAVVSFKGKY